MSQVSIDGRTVRVHTTDEYDVLVARPSVFGNPFTTGTKEQNIAAYAAWIRLRPALIDTARRMLRGKRIACYCTLNQPCHADVLVKICDEIGA